VTTKIPPFQSSSRLWIGPSLELVGDAPTPAEAAEYAPTRAGGWFRRRSTEVSSRDSDGSIELLLAQMFALVFVVECFAGRHSHRSSDDGSDSDTRRACNDSDGCSRNRARDRKDFLSVVRRLEALGRAFLRRSGLFLALRRCSRMRRTAQSEHGHCGQSNDLLRDTSEERVREAVSTMGAHDDEVSCALLRIVEDLRRRNALAYDPLDFDIVPRTMAVNESFELERCGLADAVGRVHRQLRATVGAPQYVLIDVKRGNARAERLGEHDRLLERWLRKLAKVDRNEDLANGAHANLRSKRRAKFARARACSLLTEKHGHVAVRVYARP
jgi:hypothetical protein